MGLPALRELVLDVLFVVPPREVVDPLLFRAVVAAEAAGELLFLELPRDISVPEVVAPAEVDPLCVEDAAGFPSPPTEESAVDAATTVGASEVVMLSVSDAGAPVTAFVPFSFA